jgi:hypothetical protein
MDAQKLRDRLVMVALLFDLLMANIVPAIADDVQSRIQDLNQRINFGLRQGAIKPGQADRLRQTLDDIGSKATALRKANRGRLNPTDLAGIESRLNQQTNIIHSYNQAGSRNVVAKNATGPAWVAGSDGAQSPRKLKRQMKIQEQRQLHQFDQANMQIREQQQQQYEKEMLQKLGSQRPEILKNKQDLERIRQDTGAN